MSKKRKRQQQIVALAKAEPITSDNFVEVVRCTRLRDADTAAKDLGFDLYMSSFAPNARVAELMRLVDHVEYVFSRDLSVRNDRYSKSFHAMYASKDKESASAEMAHYEKENAKAKGAKSSHASFDIIAYGIDWEGRSVVPLQDKVPELKYSKDRSYCQALGESTLNCCSSIDKTDRTDCKEFPSARVAPNSRGGASGLNYAVSDKERLSSIGITGTATIEVYADALGRRRSRVSFT